MELVLLLFLPFFQKYRQKMHLEERRLSDTQVYMEQLLYAFSRQGKVLTSLEEVLVLFPSGRMHQTIQRALQLIRYDYEEEDCIRRGLMQIEQNYPNERLHTMHRFLYEVERFGGESEGILELLLKDMNEWRKRLDVYRKEYRQARLHISLAIFIAWLVCLVTQYLLPAEITITDHIVQLISTVLFFVLLLWLYLAANKRMAVDWLQYPDSKANHRLAEKYRHFCGYQEKRERRVSICLAVLPVLAGSVAFVCKKYPIVYLCTALTIFFLYQHKIGHFLEKRLLTREIEKAFPKWLMEISLLLQMDNVQVSIAKTVKDAPAVLKPALEEFEAKLRDNPESAEPYLQFMQEFSLPQVQSAMKMLYAVSMGSGGNEKEQLKELVARNLNLMNQAEELKNQDAFAGMYLLFLAPAVVGGMKLLADMTIFMLTFFAQSGGR